MMLRSINPADGSTLKTFTGFSEADAKRALAHAAAAAPAWAALPVAERRAAMLRAAQVLRVRREEFARLITQEMGKLIQEARAEIDKCVWGCEYYAERAAAFLAEEEIETDAGRSYVAYEPLGTVLAVMPWNFPFWQVFRAAAPMLMAGNTMLLKHASNVPQCALAIEGVFKEAGFPEAVFQTLLIPAAMVARVVEDDRVHAVTLTGSEAAGREVAAVAGAHLKKTVLELGGSDAFVVLEDAALDDAVRHAVASRFQNAGQSCVAAKRFVVVESVAQDFVQRLKRAVEGLRMGDPMNEATTLGPLARHDLRDALHQQVLESIARGAVAVTGCAPEGGPGAFYQASILDRVRPGMPAYEEELFGPVAAIIRAKDEADALRIANDSRFGLGGSVWTADVARGERMARQLQCGVVFVNGMVKSDPRLPFGGVKHSGYGRELAVYGIREFVNVKTVWIR